MPRKKPPFGKQRLRHPDRRRGLRRLARRIPPSRKGRAFGRGAHAARALRRACVAASVQKQRRRIHVWRIRAAPSYAKYGDAAPSRPCRFLRDPAALRSLLKGLVFACLPRFFQSARRRPVLFPCISDIIFTQYVDNIVKQCPIPLGKAVLLPRCAARQSSPAKAYPKWC